MAAPPDSPPVQGPAPRQKRSGCLIAAAVAGGIVLLFVVAIVVGVVHFLGTKEGKSVVTTAAEAAKIGIQAQSAPGTSELRKLGCAQAAVMDADAWLRLAALVQQDASAPRGEPPASALVSCTGSLLRAPPGCDDVLRAYLAAVPPPRGRILVQARSPTAPRAGCSNLYEADGTFVQAEGTP